MASNILNKQIFKKWWFWVGLFVVFSFIGLVSGPADTSAPTSSSSESSNSAAVKTGKLPILNKENFTGKEGLVAFHELSTMGYAVTAKYVNESAPSANQELTQQFKSADVNSCQDRLGFDAYLVSDVTQDSDIVLLTLTNTPTSSQTCPAGTTNDL